MSVLTVMGHTKSWVTVIISGLSIIHIYICGCCWEKMKRGPNDFDICQSGVRDLPVNVFFGHGREDVVNKADWD